MNPLLIILIILVLVLAYAFAEIRNLCEYINNAESVIQELIKENKTLKEINLKILDLKESDNSDL